MYKHYKLLTIKEGEEDEEDESGEEGEEDKDYNDCENDTNPLDNITNIDIIINKYNKLYRNTQEIIPFILNPNHTFILYNIHFLLDINTYKQTLSNCIKQKFIKKFSKE